MKKAFSLLRVSIVLALAAACGEDPAGTNQTSNSPSAAGPTNAAQSSSNSSTATTGTTSGGQTMSGSTGVGGTAARDSTGSSASDTGTTAASAGGSTMATSTATSAADTSVGGASTGSQATITTGAGGTTGGPDPNCGTHKWACWPMPNMVGSGLPNEASYTDNGDGTVTDDITQLVWQKEQPDQAMAWQDAIGYCEALSLGGADDWRLPTRIEITSVLDHSDAHTGWAAEGFPGARSGFHFSGSEWILSIPADASLSDRSWAFNASDGIFSNNYVQSDTASLRCVRGGGDGEGPSEPARAPPDQYTVIAEGEVLDNYTGLIWQRGDTDQMVDWQGAVEYCASLGLNGNSWRLPSIREISTLVDEAEVAPSINREMFPDTHYGSNSNNWYWATPQRGSAAWAINFDDGFTGTNTGAREWNTFGPAWARCVR